MLRRILNINSSPLIESECWTYYKFAIIQTSDYFDIWLTSHMDLYIDQSGNAVFGENGRMYPLSYYGDILNINEINIFDVPASRVVTFLIKQINMGNYIIIDLNYKRLLSPEVKGFHLHETLIYGYDQEKQEFLFPALENGTFKENRVGFEILKRAYQECLEYYYGDIIRLFNRRLWFLGMTIVSLKNNYANANKYYDLIRKINTYKEGKMYTRKCGLNEDENNAANTYFTGIACLNYITRLIKQSLEDGSIESDAVVEKYRKSCLKILEYQRIILRSIEWAFIELKINNNESSALLTDYRSCCNKTNSAIMLFFKYLKVRDSSIIDRIINILIASFELEKKLLPDIVELIKNSYINRELMSVYECNIN